jgi:hypothetical protein
MSAALCESQESKRANAQRAGGSALIAVGFAVVFFGVLSGASLLHLGEALLGAAILTATVAAVVLMAAWGLRLGGTDS